MTPNQIVDSIVLHLEKALEINGSPGIRDLTPLEPTYVDYLNRAIFSLERKKLQKVFTGEYRPRPRKRAP